MQTAQLSRGEAPGPRIQNQPKHQAHASGAARPQSLPSQGQTPRSRSVTPPPQQAGQSRSSASRSRSATPPRLSQQATWQTQGDFRVRPTNGTGGMSLSRHSPPRRSHQLASQANIRVRSHSNLCGQTHCLIRLTCFVNDRHIDNAVLSVCPLSTSKQSSKSF